MERAARYRRGDGARIAVRNRGDAEDPIVDADVGEDTFADGGALARRNGARKLPLVGIGPAPTDVIAGSALHRSPGDRRVGADAAFDLRLGRRRGAGDAR